MTELIIGILLVQSINYQNGSIVTNKYLKSKTVTLRFLHSIKMNH